MQEDMPPMDLLITGADRPLGRLVAEHFRGMHRLRVTGMTPSVPGEIAGVAYRAADLRRPEEVGPLVEGMDAVLHLAEYDPTPLEGPRAEQERLDIAARGTYVLLCEAREAGVERVVLVSSLALFDAYPDDFVVDETWQPEPEADAESLAPFLSETVCREFVREGGICAVCLRFGALGEVDGTEEADAVGAIEQALAMPFGDRGYRWHLFHISSDDRFPLRGNTSVRGPFNLTKRGDR